MVSDLVLDIALGVYLGILAGIFPAVVAFGLGFIFKYLTGVSIPGLGVVVLAGALAGISGGLLGLLDEEVAQSGAGIAAFLVVLMLSLWAHAQGDKLGANVPRHLTLSGLRKSGLSTELLDRVDTYGQIRIKPVGTVEDIEGFPPLPEDTREAIRSDTWKFPVGLSIPELERKLAEKLTTQHALSEVTVSINSDGLAEISAAPEVAGLSRRVQPGKRAASVDTLLPTGLAAGDQVTLALTDRTVTGPVVSARTDGGSTPAAKPAEPVPETVETDGGEETPPADPPPRAPTTDGGQGSVTVAVAPDDARQILREDFAKLTVQSRGKGREHEAIDVLQRGNAQLQLVTIRRGGRFDGETIESAGIRSEFNVAVLAIRRRTERIVAPYPDTVLAGGDELIVAGPSSGITTLREAVA